jgi:carboxymethylenebutenolidase
VRARTDNLKIAARIAALTLCAITHAVAATPDTVHFMSADGETRLVGYLYTPEGKGPHPAIVMLHGRAGAYSSLKRGQHTAEALSARHRMWGGFWASRGYVALLVDSFTPRGHGDGFPKHSYSERPAAVSERTVRPLDAYGALEYLRSRADVRRERIGVHGWSNGGMTVLSTIDRSRAGPYGIDPAHGFRAALAQYPSCRTQSREPQYRPYAPLLILAAEEDDEVSPHVCRALAEALASRGDNVEFVMYAGAHHSYDDPGKTKQSHAPNRAAMRDSLERAAAFFERQLNRDSK